MASWAEQYVDERVEQAWLSLRLQLAERFYVALEAGCLEPFEMTTATGESLLVSLFEGEVLVEDGDRLVSTTNVDEAAYEITRMLREVWHVIHPVFIDSEVVDVPEVADAPIAPQVPLLGHADTQQTLQSWVEAAFQAVMGEPLKVAPDGSISWSGRPGCGPVVVAVRDEHWIEVWTVLATQVSLSRARRAIERLAKQWPACTFALRDERIVMSRVVDSAPFIPEHLHDAVRMHLDLAAKLRGVQGKVRRTPPKPAVPPALLALLPSANRVPSRVLAEEVRRADLPHEELRAGQSACRREWSRARRRAAGQDDPHRVLRRQVTAWQRLARAIETALQQVEEAA